MLIPQESVIAAVVARILSEEGGVVINPGEGYVTRWGQTPSWLMRWRLLSPATIEDAERNYRVWLALSHLDALCTVDDPLCESVIDFAVHSGERVAITALQRALGVVADGVLGPVTEMALIVCARAHIAAQVVAGRLELIHGLIADRPDRYVTFARGWGRRLARQIRRLA